MTPLDLATLDVKHSTHKTAKGFLKACAKEGLIKLKETKGDVVVTGASLPSPPPSLPSLPPPSPTH